MAFPPQFLEELRARLPLSDVVGKRMRLIRAGREFKAPCPFHNEKTPSFYVNDQKGFFHCFGCGAHGDIIGFAMRHDNLAFPEAVEQLASEAGLQVPQSTPEDRQRFERQKSLHDLVEASCRWFEAQLAGTAGRAAFDYLKSRGLDEDTMVRFRLGFAPADGNALRIHLAREGYKEEDMLEAGVVRASEYGGGAFSFFRNRVMFPVTDRRGRVVAFGGRIMEGDGPKYINSADNPLFHKGRLLYNMSRARQAAADGEPIVVVEGYMDVIALVRAGFTGAVAPLGTALTETQILELWKLAPPGRRVPILCFDGDKAGQRAAFRAVERVLPHLLPDHSVRVAFMEGGEDPDSLLRKQGAKAMRQVLDGAIPLADVLWRMEEEGRVLDSPEARAGLQAALDERVGMIADRTVQTLYRDEMRNRFFERFRARPGFKPSQRFAGGSGFKGKGFRQPRNTDPPQDFQRSRPRPAREVRERVLLATLLNHPELFDEVGESIGGVEFSLASLDVLRQAVVSTLSEHPGLDAAGLGSHLTGKGFSDLADAIGPASFLYAFARPDATLEHARRGWYDVWGQTYTDHIKSERREATQSFARDMNADNWSRVRALLEAEAGAAEFDDPDLEY
ncbi:DNA primase [Skermanella stibiiresistens SB22]|uniref:DNA primase n=1 Tax=Skermanella stibiiresistens SB22 TaxID=1385369 RepID=W9GY65_9PROT|nr:DNA primase [Skermanella stibiiresistens]EWY38875.1 DNA primase [Skermanella stibiiresistens SB22]